MLSKWVRAHDPDKASAKRTLDKTPMAETAHGVKVPFPYKDKSTYKDKFSNEEINQGINSAPIKSVPIDELHAIQHSVKPERVKEYMDHPDAVREGAKHPAARTPVDEPVIVKSGGKLLIHDGHHRLSAMKLMGEKFAKARYVDLDAMDKV